MTLNFTLYLPTRDIHGKGKTIADCLFKANQLCQVSDWYPSELNDFSPTDVQLVSRWIGYDRKGHKYARLLVKEAS